MSPKSVRRPDCPTCPPPESYDGRCICEACGYELKRQRRWTCDRVRCGMCGGRMIWNQKEV